jgi:hypothetical protein
LDGGTCGCPVRGSRQGLAPLVTRLVPWTVVRTGRETDYVLSLPQEWRRSLSWQGRHRVLVARLTLLLTLNFLIALIGTVAIYFLERHAPGTEINTVFDAFYFTAVQLLTRLLSAEESAEHRRAHPEHPVRDLGVPFVGGTAGALVTFFLSDDDGA